MFTVQAGLMTIQINDTGDCRASVGAPDDRRGESPAHPSPLLQLVSGGRILSPKTASFDAATGRVTLTFADGVSAVVAVTIREGYAVFEAVRIDAGAGEEPDAVIWGPFAVTPDESIGESVGVVHDGQFAIGMQALNAKTIGGWPLGVARPAYAQPAYAEGESDGRRQPADSKFEYEDCAAWPAAGGGSLLQAYARNRTRPGRRPVWNLPDVEVEPLAGNDAAIAGTRIALFGCAVDRVLDTIEAIELGEGLPHPMLDGVWGKKSPAANQSYLITDFSEATMAEAVAYAKAAGLGYVYHPDPFEQWGHFRLKRSHFPNGDAGMKAAVGLAEREGVRVGIHTLTNFTTLNDPYVTPVPDRRLQKVGTARLAEPAGADDRELAVDDPHPFRAKLFRQTAHIGDELIEYDRVSDEAPWRLLGVKRGANGTAAAAHAAGEPVGRLWDHPYDVFFPNIELQDAYSDRIARLMADTGLRQISFDGLEGLFATGQDGYGVHRFVEQCYRNWKHEVINDASIVVPNYLWHIFTRFNWGEPWGAATREGQLEWRLSNQRYFARNFIPRMLGWFLVRSASDRFEATSLDEIEWVLSKAAGFDAGFALVADYAVLKRNGNVAELLDAVRLWESARRAGAFTAEQRARLSEPRGDWHLEAAGEGRWRLFPVDVSKPFVCSPDELQPGQPGGADWALFNKRAEQPLRFCMRVSASYGNDDAAVKRPTLYTDGEYMTFETAVAAGEYLVCDGERTGRVYDRNWNLLRTVQATADAPVVRRGGQTLSFNCKFEGDPKPIVSLKVFMRGEPEPVEAG